MSAEARAGGDVEAIAAQLGELSERLRDPELPDSDAERLAREAADLAARAGTAIEEALREIAERGPAESDL